MVAIVSKFLPLFAVPFVVVAGLLGWPTVAIEEARAGAPNAATKEAADNTAAEDAEGMSIKEVMRFTMTKGLCQKVIQKKADPQEQLRLVQLFEAMALQQPPIGDAQLWKAKADALVQAAREVSEGKGSHAALAKAANCAACHKDHRPK
jgi:hypothetical protein